MFKKWFDDDDNDERSQKVEQKFSFTAFQFKPEHKPKFKFMFD